VLLGGAARPDHTRPGRLLPDLSLGGRSWQCREPGQGAQSPHGPEPAVNKKAIINALWKGTGAETPFTYFYYPFNKGYSTDWKIPPYDPGQARKLLGEAGQGGGFEVRVNPMVFT
jgi:hypothetical protein